MTWLWFIDCHLDRGWVVIRQYRFHRLVPTLLLVAVATLFVAMITAFPVLTLRVLVTSDRLLVCEGLHRRGRVLGLNAHIVVYRELFALYYLRPGVAIVEHHVLARGLDGQA